MKILARIVLGLALVLLGTGMGFFRAPGGGTAPAGGGQLALVRVFNQPSGTSTPADAFWTIGQPVPVGTWPSGNIVTAKLNGVSVRVNSCNEDNGMLTHADGSVRWARLLVDYSGQTIPAGGSSNLIFTVTPGSWSTSTTRTNSDWEALNDTVTLAPTSPATTIQYSGTTGVSGYDSPAGTWTATFDGGSSNKIVTVCTNALGRYVKVYANFVNSGVTHCQLRARMDYWVTEKSDTTLGPIESWGPFIDNTQLFVNSAPCTNGSGGYIADATWKRGGVTQRTQAALPIHAMGIYTLMRPDAQGDWTASDPGVWVSQDYTKVRATKTIPPFISGVTYVGGEGYPLSQAITAVNTSTGVFTVGATSGLFQPAYHAANLIEFTGSLSSLTGISLNTSYWACAKSSTTFVLFQNVAQANTGFTNNGAYACSSATGQIIPGGSYSGGMTGELDIGPTEAGLWSTAMGAPSTIPDLSWPSEWGAAYVVGNTQGFQRQARIQAFVKGNIPMWVVDTNQCVVSVLSSALTPATGTNCMGNTGLGPSRTSAQWTDRVAFGGGINVPSDGNNSVGIWFLEGSHWPGATEYMVWLLEGSEFLQDMVMQEGNRGASSRLAVFGRNGQVGGTGTSYTGLALNAFPPGSSRYGFWSFRDITNAAYAAPEGSAEQTLFRNVEQQNVDANLAYRTYKGANYASWGVYVNDDQWGQNATFGAFGAPYVSQFMQWYAQTSVGISAARDGEFITNLTSMFNPQMNVQMNSVNCSFFSDAFTTDIATSDIGTAKPGTWISTIGDLGYDDGSGGLVYGFATTGNLITAPTTGWVSDVLGTLPYVAGDKYRPLNWDADGGNRVAAPTPFVDGTTYFPTNISGATYNLSATNGGSTITVGANQTGVGGYMMPTGQTCPASGMFRSITSNPDSYAAQEIAALGVAAADGISGASTALTNMQNRMTTIPSIYSTEVNFAYGGTW